MHRRWLADTGQYQAFTGIFLQIFGYRRHPLFRKAVSDEVQSRIEEAAGHLEALRRALIAALLVVCAAGAACWFVSGLFIEGLILPARPAIEALYVFSPAEGFFIRMKAAVFGGALLFSPLWLYLFWRFLSPALYLREKRGALGLALVGALMFCAGAAAGYFFVLPRAVVFLIGMVPDGVRPMISLERYLGFALGVTACCGAAGLLPALFFGFARTGIVPREKLAAARPYVIVGIFALAALMSPPDVFSMCAMAVPLWAGYEVTIAWLRFRAAKQPKTGAGGKILSDS